MRQCCLSDLTRDIGLLSNPIAERRAKAVCGYEITSHPPEHHQKRHFRQSAPAPLTEKYYIINFVRCGAAKNGQSLFTQWDAVLDLGLHALCRDRPDFFVMSISDHNAPITSPVRVAVRIKNSSAAAAPPSRVRRSAKNAPISEYGSAAWCWIVRSLFRAGRASLRCPFHRAGFLQPDSRARLRNLTRPRYAPAHGSPSQASCSRSDPAL